MSKEHLLPIYLSDLEKAKYELNQAEKSLNASSEALEKIRWTLETEIRRVSVRVYGALITFAQQPD